MGLPTTSLCAGQSRHISVQHPGLPSSQATESELLNNKAAKLIVSNMAAKHPVKLNCDRRTSECAHGFPGHGGAVHRESRASHISSMAAESSGENDVKMSERCKCFHILAGCGGAAHRHQGRRGERLQRGGFQPVRKTCETRACIFAGCRGRTHQEQGRRGERLEHRGKATRRLAPDVPLQCRQGCTGDCFLTKFRMFDLRSNAVRRLGPDVPASRGQGGASPVTIGVTSSC